ncbi:24908_t:CDS:1, partial [Gigaspora rosea]
MNKNNSVLNNDSFPLSELNYNINFLHVSHLFPTIIKTISRASRAKWSLHLK